jgi:amino acid transporter
VSGPTDHRRPTAVKRLLLGRALASERLSSERLPTSLALPTFAADAWSSIAYAPDEILLTLALAGVAAYTAGPWIALGVVVLMSVVVLTAGNTLHEYSSGGGDYEVVRRNLGAGPGRAVGAALLVDYVLTVTVSVSQAANYLTGTLPGLHGAEMPIALGLIGVLALVNLRGVRQSGALLAVPVYLFIAAIALVVVVGAVRAATGTLGSAPSAGMTIVPDAGYAQGLTAVGAALLVLRAFSSGCVALTGVEAVGNGVPSFRPPKAHHAAVVLVVLGATSAAMMLAVLWLARATGVRFVEDPTVQLVRDGAPVPGYHQLPVVGQIAQAVSGSQSWLFALVSVATGLVLFLAANTAFNGFPNLASVLARDDNLPRGMSNRGDRLAYSNGILGLTIAAALLVWATGAQVTVQIQMYIVGVFVAMGLGQLGMVRHFGDRLRLVRRAGERRTLLLRRALAGLGLVTMTAVLVIVVGTKFLHGAWAALALMAVSWIVMSLFRRRHLRVREELRADPGTPAAMMRAVPPSPLLPGAGSVSVRPARRDATMVHAARIHALVLMTSIDLASLQALQVARCRPHATLDAVTVHAQDGDMGRTMDRWRELGLPEPLRVLYSPYRDVTGPLVTYVMSLLTRNPRDVVIVYLPRVEVGHWGSTFLHDHAARRLGALLSGTSRVVVATVPWRVDIGRRAAGNGPSTQEHPEARSAAPPEG